MTRAVACATTIPVVASCGVGTLEHVLESLIEGGADAVLAASIFHFRQHTIPECKAFLESRGVDVRS